MDPPAPSHFRLQENASPDAQTRRYVAIKISQTMLTMHVSTGSLMSAVTR